MFHFWVRPGFACCGAGGLNDTCDIYDDGGSCDAGRVWRGRKNLAPLALPISLYRILVVKVKVKVRTFAIGAHGPGVDIHTIGA